MKILFIIIFIFIIILFLPIPIAITFIYKDSVPIFKIYNFKIPLNKKANYYKSKFKSSDNVKQKKEFNINSKLFLSKISNNPFKIKIYLNSNSEFGLEDACNTAICYGALYNLYPIFLHIFSLPFNVKKFKFNISPTFNKKVLNTENKCIIVATIAKIIYMMFLYLSCKKKGEDKNV